MNHHQSVFELWNYTFLFMTLATITTFIVDMIGHRTKTISSNVFSMAVLIGIAIGEMSVSFIPISNVELKLAIAVLLTILVSVFIPLKFRTKDPELTKSRASRMQQDRQ